MKHFVLLGFLALAPSAAAAAVIAEEPFAYTVGESLIGKTVDGFAWGSQAPLASDDLIFHASSLSPASPYALPAAFPPPSGGKARIGGSGRTYVLPIGAPPAGMSTMYYSMLIDVHSLHATDVTPAILAGFANVSGTTNPTGINATLYGKPGSTPGTYQLGIGRNSNYVNATFGGDIPLGSAVFVVASIEVVTGTSNDVARLWINPPATTFGAATAPVTTAPPLAGQNLGGDSTINSFVLYQRGTNNGLSVLGSWVDELKIGTGWADVTPVPEPAAVAVIGLAAVGFLGRRRRG